jgi:hypothetical protein
VLRGEADAAAEIGRMDEYMIGEVRRASRRQTQHGGRNDDVENEIPPLLLYIDSRYEHIVPLLFSEGPDNRQQITTSMGAMLQVIEDIVSDSLLVGASASFSIRDNGAYIREFKISRRHLR